MKRARWIITAQSGSREWLYYCADESQGERMVPSAESYAARLQSKTAALRKALAMSDTWKGLHGWTVYAVNEK